MSKVLGLFRSVAARVGVGVVLAGGLMLGLASTVIGTSPSITPTLAANTSCGYGGSACEDKLQAGLTAKQVVPSSAGQAGATARVGLTLNEEQMTVCGNINASKLKGPITDVAVYKGGSGHNGALQFDFGPVTLNSSGHAELTCATGVPGALDEMIEAHPAQYYVLVKTASHPNGAVRGQLAHLS